MEVDGIATNNMEAVQDSMSINAVKVKSKEVGKLILEAVRLQKPEQRSSIENLKGYLVSNCNLDVVTADSIIKSCLHRAVEKGILSKIGGKYTANQRHKGATTRRKSSKKRSTPKSSGRPRRTGGRKIGSKKSGRKSASKKTSGRKSGRKKTIGRKSGRKKTSGRKSGEASEDETGFQNSEEDQIAQLVYFLLKEGMKEGVEVESTEEETSQMSLQV